MTNLIHLPSTLILREVSVSLILSHWGKIALNKDPHLESIVTDWVIHFYLSFGTKGLQRPPENPAEWGGWTYFIYSFLPEFESFTIDDLIQSSSSIFSQESSQKLKDNFRVLLRAYTEKQALLGCHLLNKSNLNRFYKDKIDLSNPLIPYLIGYILARLWKRDYGDNRAVLTENIINQKMGLIPILGINRNESKYVFNNLEKRGIINQRSAKPYLLGSQPEDRDNEQHTQIIRRWNNPLDLLERAYDEDRTMPNQPLSKVLEPFLDEDEGSLPCLEFTLDNLFIIPFAS